MLYNIDNNKIIIRDTSQFNIEHIVNSGQIFRYTLQNDKCRIIAKNVVCYLKYDNLGAIIESNNIDFVIKYFDLDRDYNEIKKWLNNYQPLKNAIAFGEGLRILRQDPLETIISFIISANNNIPRIKGILNRLCEHLGENCGGYKSFPTLSALASENVEFYRKIGAGYRAEYLVNTITAIKNGFDLELSAMSTTQARNHLMQLSGVGSKVADCILLFAYHKQDVFPLDTWTKKVYKDMGLPLTNNIQTMAQNITNIFGAYSGYAQQYLYYYYRERKKII